MAVVDWDLVNDHHPYFDVHIPSVDDAHQFLVQDVLTALRLENHEAKCKKLLTILNIYFKQMS